MKAEMEVIQKSNTWQLVDPPTEFTPIDIKWVFKTKFNENGHIEKCKAILVAKGYAQMYEIYYTKVFALVARLDTMRSLLALVPHN